MIDLLNNYQKITNYRLKNFLGKQYLFISLLLIGFVGTFLILIPVKIAIAKIQYPQPQAMLILGGNTNREQFTAQFARFYPDIPIWLSSGSKNAIASQIFRDGGIDLNRVYLDRRAVDTVTNFTSLVDELKQHKIKHLYLITSGYHLPRASAIATIVLGSKGIAFSPISVPDKDRRGSESKLKVIRDAMRALMWLFIGRTGASLNNL